VTLQLAEIRAAARDALGHRSLRPGQAEAIRAITSGRDTLAILPTGAGKSAIYQLAGREIEGPTVVVSPLIALQRDQLDGLREMDLPAAAVNGSVAAGERDAAIDRFARRDLEFLLLAPEQLADPDVLDRIAAGRPSLFVVDEAHCVAEWGREFRPEYRRLGAVADALGRPAILALTATASPMIRAEIIDRLGLRDPAVVVRGFDRPNLTLAVATFTDLVAKRRGVVERVVELDGAGIVYVGTRRAAEEVAEALVEAGVAAAPYHAGLAARRRDATQDAFMRGETRVIVATTAFGMGIDKADVRFVLHGDVAESLDAYHQEIGRAGRDGDPADAILCYRPEDLGLRRYQRGPAAVDEAAVRAALRALRRTGATDVAELAGRIERSRRKTEAIVARLEELGAVATDPDGRLRLVEDAAEGDAGGTARRRRPDDLAVAVVAAQERRRTVERSRVEMIRAYAETSGCRRAALLGYFGEPFDPPCGNCDRCLTGAAAAVEPNAEPTPWHVDDRVRHPTFGAGVVTGIADGVVTVAFEDVGYRTIDASLAETDRLLVADG
jgi:ATP-dependent DNA helicase RecQ